MARILFLALALSFFTIKGSAQVREIPEAVKTAFTKQYPTADSVKYEDNLVSVQVHFRQNGEKFVASYNNKGEWKETQKDWTFEQLPQEVKDGFAKSKYADWETSETKIVYKPAGTEYYRIKVEKNTVQKKNLYFNKAGRLVDDGITL